MLWTASGFGMPLFDLMAQMLHVAAQLWLILLLLLLSTGWSITSDTFAPDKRKIILGTSLALVCSYVLLFFWVAGRDQASTLYAYDSMAGFVIVILNILAGLQFVLNIKTSYTTEPYESPRRTFYLQLGLGYIGYFFSLAFLVLVATISPAWKRERVVTILQLCIDGIAYSVLVYLLWPSRMQQYFLVNRGGPVKGPHAVDECD